MQRVTLLTIMHIINNMEAICSKCLGQCTSRKYLNVVWQCVSVLQRDGCDGGKYVDIIYVEES